MTFNYPHIYVFVLCVIIVILFIEVDSRFQMIQKFYLIALSFYTDESKYYFVYFVLTMMNDYE